MHIPDGFLNPPVTLGAGVVSATAVGMALRRVRPETEVALAPRMGLCAAFIFAAQMVNFPVLPGVSGHLLGALLAAVLVGPHAATVVMAAVTLIQTFFFLDGGHTALGANMLNMGLAGTYGGYAVYRLLAGGAPSRRRALVSAAVAAWASVQLGAVLTAGMLVLSGAVPGSLAYPVLLSVHALIGGGEAVITVAALGLLWQARPDLLTGRPASAGNGWGAWVAIGGGLVAVMLLAPFASSSPDGLEWAAERLGFAETARDAMLPGPFPDYSLPGWSESTWVAAVVSALGSILMLGGVHVLLRLRPRNLLPGFGGPSVPLDPRIHLACALGTVLTVVLLPAQQAGKVLLLAGLAAIWIVAVRVPPRWLAGRLLPLLPFIALVSLAAPLPDTGVAASERYGWIMLRSLTSLLVMAAFLSATPEPLVLATLRAYRMPVALAETLAFALRYLRVLQAEAQQMLLARAARGGSGGVLALRAGATGAIVGSLFVRTFERAERVGQAMQARGYNGTPAVSVLPRCRAADWWFGVGFFLFLAGVWWWH